jgi:hypothetical protein
MLVLANDIWFMALKSFKIIKIHVIKFWYKILNNVLIYVVGNNYIKNLLKFLGSYKFLCKIQFS